MFSVLLAISVENQRDIRSFACKMLRLWLLTVYFTGLHHAPNRHAHVYYQFFNHRVITESELLFECHEFNKWSGLLCVCFSRRMVVELLTEATKYKFFFSKWLVIFKEMVVDFFSCLIMREGTTVTPSPTVATTFQVGNFFIFWKIDQVGGQVA